MVKHPKKCLIIDTNITTWSIGKIIPFVVTHNTSCKYVYLDRL